MRPCIRAALRTIDLRHIGILVCILGTSSLFLLTLAPTVQGFDSAEVTVGAYDLGLIHAPGYPLYMLIGHAFAQVPVGNVGLRLNLMSAVFGVLTVLLLYRLLFIETGRMLVALTASFMFATAPVFWSQAIRAEVYTLHTFLVVGALSAWLDAQRHQRAKSYVLCFVLLGLGMGNHLTTALLWLSILASADWSSAYWRRLTIGSTFVGLVVASACYLYFPWRAAANPRIDYVGSYFGVDLRSLQGLWWLISGRMFRCAFYLDLTPPALWREVLRFARQLWDNSLGIGLILAAWGWPRTRQSNPRWNRLLSFYLLANLAAFLIYHVVDKEVMFIPAYIVGSIWVADGINRLIDLAQARLRQPQPMRLHNLIYLGLGVIIVIGAWLSWRSVDLSQNRKVYDLAVNLVESVEPSTMIVNHWVTASVFDYLSIVEGRRPDVTNLNLDFFFLAQQGPCDDRSGASAQQAWFSWLRPSLEQRPLCFVEPLPAIPDGMSWIKQAACWKAISADGRD